MVILTLEERKVDTVVVMEVVAEEEVDIAAEAVVEGMAAEVLVSTNVDSTVIRSPILVWRDRFSGGMTFKKRESTLTTMMISPSRLLVITFLIPSMCTPLKQLERS